MPHDTPLIATIVTGLCLAFVFGAIANRLRLPLVAGYLLAGVAIGPFTPGYVADQSLANELAEIGIILLMFGVGLHFSWKDLVSVGQIAIPGALAQTSMAALLGTLLAIYLGWTAGAGLIFGLGLSVASTVVLLRALQQRRLLETQAGRIAMGWLIVEDILMVFALVLLPALAPLLGGKSEPLTALGSGTGGVATAFLVTAMKLMAFMATMLLVGRKLIPWILHVVAHTGSRELFRLAVLSIALGFAFGAAKLFGVSFALGAFFAGMILSESTLSQQAANESLPMRDAFAVLFFVSVGMLFDPAILLRDPWPILATVLIIVVGKSIAAFGIVRAFGHPTRTALTISASLAQIGEFSFILAQLGVELGVMDSQGRDLILAGAILSILINPLLFFALARVSSRLDRKEAAGDAQPGAASESEPDLPPPTRLENHVVLVGFGRVGSRVGENLISRGVPLFVIDDNPDHVSYLSGRGVETFSGNGTTGLAFANPLAARAIFVAVADSFEAGQIVAQARAANAEIEIVARAHSEAEAEHLRQYGATVVVLGEQEIADAMIEHLSEETGAPNRSSDATTSQTALAEPDPGEGQPQSLSEDNTAAAKVLNLTRATVPDATDS